MMINKINKQQKDIADKLSKAGIYCVGVKIHNNRATLDLGTAYLDFELLNNVSVALATRDINIEGSVEHGYYDEINANLCLDVGLS